MKTFLWLHKKLLSRFDSETMSESYGDDKDENCNLLGILSVSSRMQKLFHQDALNLIFGCYGVPGKSMDNQFVLYQGTTRTNSHPGVG
jgi:hypothetical protein